MKFKQIFYISNLLRYSLTVTLLCSSLLTVYGLIKNLAQGGHMIQLQVGMAISIMCIVVAAIPVKGK